MATKRRTTKKIEIKYLEKKPEGNPPCFGEWESSCEKGLCGACYEECRAGVEKAGTYAQGFN